MYRHAVYAYQSIVRSRDGEAQDAVCTSRGMKRLDLFVKLQRVIVFVALTIRGRFEDVGSGFCQCFKWRQCTKGTTCMRIDQLKAIDV